MEKYYLLEIAFNESNYDKILNELYITGITSIIEENGVIKVYLPSQQSELLETIKEILTSDKIVKNHSMYVSPFNDKDWNKEWESSIEPVYIKDKIIIYPSWKKDSIKSKENNILIEIDPKMSFGTGHNETTQLILELMCDYISKNDGTMLDYGCGTGILAIAGIKLGLKKAVAIDLDEDAIMNASEYLKTNKVEKNISLYMSDIRDVKEKDFDAVCANITSMVIIDSLPIVYKKLKQKGKLFVSGILKDEIEEVKETLLKNKFEIMAERFRTEWASYYCLKR